jgi:bacterioferritin
MQGNPAVVQLLNDLLKLELTAVHQYLLHAETLGNWGYERLHHQISEEVTDELGHARRLAARILFLDGRPDVQALGTVQGGGNAEELFRQDLEVERTANEALNRAMAECRSAGDNGTVELLEHMLEDTEEHRHWLESQLELIGQIGLQNYLGQQLRKSS